LSRCEAVANARFSRDRDDDDGYRDDHPRRAATTRRVRTVTEIAMNVDGDWHLIINSPMGKQDVVISLKQEGDRLTGTMLNNTTNLSTDLFDGAVDGDQLSWKAKLKQIHLTLTFAMQVDGDTMSGKVKAAMFGSFDAAGERH
jgi:hypothetical protein